jgi:DNA-binding response OmpR family regulator
MKILLIEDDATINENIRDYLVQNDFEIDVAFDGQVGEKLLKEGQYDCVILDINLPFKNGYELCREFRLVNNSTPILMLTAFDEIEDKVQGFESGTDDYMTKPFYMKEMLIRVRSLIKRSANMALTNHQEIISMEGLVINQKSMTVKRDGSEIALTPREYQILLKLSKAKGELVSKKDLVKEIWGGTFDANTNTIEVYINFLRKKLDKPFEKQLIKTKIGYGYYLDLG